MPTAQLPPLFLNHELQCNGTGVAKRFSRRYGDELDPMYSGICPHKYFTQKQAEFIQCKHIVREGTPPPFHSATSMERFHRPGQAVRRCSYRAVAYSLLQYILATYCSIQTPAPILREEFAQMFYMLKPPSAPFARWRAT